MMISLLLLCHNIFSAKLVPPNGCGKGQALRVLGKQFSCVHFSKEKILFAKTLTAPLSPSVLPKKIIMAHKKISIYTHTCSICNRELTHSEIAAQQDQHIDFNSYVCDDDEMKDPKKLEKEIKRSKAVAEIAKNLVESAKVQVDFMRVKRKVVSGDDESQFVSDVAMIETEKQLEEREKRTLKKLAAG